MPTIEDRLHQWQQELLDFSNRNPLLNFKYAARNPTTVELAAPGAAEIFDWLSAGKTYTIVGNDQPNVTPEEVNTSDIDEGAVESQSGDEVEVLDLIADEPDPELLPLRPGTAMSRLSSERSNKVLLRLATRARASELEQGINTLFAAFGLLKWTETPGSTSSQFAPLVLVPIRVEELTREGRFRISATGDDAEFNQTLLERMRRDFGLELPTDLDEEQGLERLLDEVREAVAARSGWEVVDSVHLGHFQFHKLRMYKDLIEHARVAAEHDIVLALGTDYASIGDLPDDVPAEDELDRVVTPDQSFTFLDADSSQLLAVEKVKRGANLIIEGPPGTGKSQTIANIIAETIAAGKTVLFVSEKAAAIDVVYRRLRDEGLGEFCLPLHSHKANKQEIIRELAGRLESAPTRALSVQDQLALEELQDHRLNLDSYAQALHRRRVPLQASVYWVHGELARLHDVPLIPGFANAFGDLTQAQLARAKQLLDELARHAEVLEQGNRHIWFGVRTLSFAERTDVRELLNLLPEQITRLRELARVVTRRLGLPELATKEDIARLIELTNQLPTEYGLLAAWFQPESAERARVLLTEARAHAAAVRDIEARLAAEYESEFVGFDARSAVPAYEAGLITRWFSGTYRSSRSRLRSLTRSRQNRSHQDELAALHELVKLQGHRAWIRENQLQLRELLDLSTEEAIRLGEASWESLHATLSKAPVIARLIGHGAMSPAFLSSVRDPVSVELRTQIEGFARMAEALLAEIARLEGAFRADACDVAVPGDLQELMAITQARQGRMLDLDNWLQAQQALSDARDAGLAPAVQAMRDRGIPAAQWATAWRRLALTSWLDTVMGQEPVLARFSGSAHDRRVSAFARRDREVLRLGAARVREAWAARKGTVSAVFGGEPRVLQFEAQKKKRHKPLRKLFAETPNLLPTLKPCLMMSPLSVAYYLPADRYTFDVVIFDEASQVRPHDAIGAIMRGKQLVVAGDSKQLPPTSFFDRASDTETEDDSQDIRALESILDALQARGMPASQLLWHYRSRHEDLIAYSNHHFYGGRLVTFPSPGAERLPDLGIRFEHVEDGIYDDERDRVLKTPLRVNRVEAQRVARLVMEHARLRSNESLMVVTLGTSQRDVVEEEIKQARQLEMDLEEFFSEDKAEPFYVKALEQVQGDERDVVMISVGYGKNSKGTLSHNFGPINQQGGERRLNVLVTRARKQVVLVSSIRYTDIDPYKTSHAGPKLLRHYLEFAEVGASVLDRAENGLGFDRNYESPFEEQVGEALIRQGYSIKTQIGSSGFRVDMAVIDPRDPGRFLLGIECDGRTYHQSKTARDRDRLRQEKLEDLGWRIHRIWSTEWMKNPDHELQRVKERVDELLAQPLDSPKAVPVRLHPAPMDEAPIRHESASPNLGQAVEPVVIAVPYEVADFATPFTEIWDTTPREVAAAVARIVETEGPIHQELLRKRLTNLWGYGRSGRRIANAITRATEVGIQLGQIRQQGDFLWPALTREVHPRSAAENGEMRTIDQIPAEEIASAVRTILSHAFSLETDELLSQTARVFGFQRVGADIRARILSVARQLYVDQEVVYKEDRVQLLR
ncbi:MAG: DUF3320 domain-containing protein [Hyphomicrobiaceae bacterium]|nr:DUF3320 domain-containing protein [Hyphomicrobiaceae bacterium]